MVDLRDGGDEHFCCIATEFFGPMKYILYTQNFPWYKLALHVCTTTTFILFFNFIHVFCTPFKKMTSIICVVFKELPSSEKIIPLILHWVQGYLLNTFSENRVKNKVRLVAKMCNLLLIFTKFYHFIPKFLLVEDRHYIDYNTRKSV